MSKSSEITFDRRRFLSGTTALGAVSILGWPEISHAEPPPEIRKIRLVNGPAMCLAPQYIARELLHLEGFNEVEYVTIQGGTGKYTKVWISEMLAEGLVDISQGGTPGHIVAADNGGQVIVLSGIHAGCYELFGHAPLQAIRDLKGSRIAASDYGDDYLFLSSVLAYVGIDARKDVDWVNAPSNDEAKRLFLEHKVDGFLGFPPAPQEVRAKKIGKLILNTAHDKPWSHYFCCSVAANRQFVRKYPIATKRALRAFLKATDICANDPTWAARYMVERGLVESYDYALDLVTDLPYQRWREANPEDTFRFFALRLHEVGMIKTHPNELITKGTDWRFLNELKKQLKA
jgi:NitT/TauT family transport system substrate-binding protein